jgi:DNA-directed RNA polymerase specialized sigma24 family protein
LPDPDAIRELVSRHHRRLYVLLRALQPRANDADTALEETIRRIEARGQAIPADRFTDWADRLAIEIAGESRTSSPKTSFSDDLLRQLADSAGPYLARSVKRPAALAEILAQLPPPERDLLRRKYELGMTTDQIALAENRPFASVSRDLVSLHASMVAALRDNLPDTGPEPPGGAGDLGRLTGQLLDGTISDDGRLVLETLLLADAAAQAHYHRHAVLVAELTWHYGGPRALPPLPRQPAQPAVTKREWIVTYAFLAACVAALTLVLVVVIRQFS